MDFRCDPSSIPTSRSGTRTSISCSTSSKRLDQRRYLQFFVEGLGVSISRHCTIDLPGDRLRFSSVPVAINRTSVRGRQGHGAHFRVGPAEEGPVLASRLRHPRVRFPSAPSAYSFAFVLALVIGGRGRLLRRLDRSDHPDDHRRGAGGADHSAVHGPGRLRAGRVERRGAVLLYLDDPGIGRLADPCAPHPDPHSGRARTGVHVWHRASAGRRRRISSAAICCRRSPATSSSIW